MEYTTVISAVEDAWGGFYYKLSERGFTDKQIEEFEKQLNYKDVYNDVDDCAMEAVR